MPPQSTVKRKPVPQTISPATRSASLRGTVRLNDFPNLAVGPGQAPSPPNALQTKSSGHGQSRASTQPPNYRVAFPLPSAKLPPSPPSPGVLFTSSHSRRPSATHSEGPASPRVRSTSTRPASTSVQPTTPKSLKTRSIPAIAPSFTPPARGNPPNSDTVVLQRSTQFTAADPRIPSEHARQPTSRLPKVPTSQTKASTDSPAGSTYRVIPRTSSSSPPDTSQMAPLPESSMRPNRKPSFSNASPPSNPLGYGGEHLHMRQLLSKPASLQTDMDLSRSRAPPQGHKNLPDTIRATTPPSRLKGKEKLHLKTNVIVEQDDGEDYSFLNLASPITPALSPCPSLVQTASMSEREQERQLVSEKKSRNVLRRKASHRAPNAQESLKPPSYGSPVPSAPSSRSPSRSGENEAGGVVKQAFSEAVSMTPARELVMAYKQKERLYASNMTPSHRESSPGDGGHSVESNPPNQGESATQQPTESENSSRFSHPYNEREPQPYYTVLGSTSGRVVAVGGPEDAWSNVSLGSMLTASMFSNSGQSSSRQAEVDKGDGLGRTLSRKISGRWRKTSHPTELGREDEISSLPVNRPSLQERRYGLNVGSLEQALSLRTSLDNYYSRPSARQTKSPGSRSVPETGFAYHRSTDSGLLHNQPRSRKSEPGGRENGSKIWKLMKRISTGALKETSYSQQNAPPPVPALPKDYQKRSFDIPRRPDLNTPSQSRSSSSTRPSVKGAVPLPPLTSVPPVPSQPSSSTPTTHRPSTTTRSSSPVSSDVASSKFFHKSHSARSSTSSLGEEIRPPVPSHKFIPQHIVPPSELNKLGQDEVETGSKHKNLASMGINPPKLVASVAPTLASSDDWMIVRSPQDELMSLGPFPRHNQRRAPRTAGDGRPPSPIIPEFSSADPINAFTSRKPTKEQKPPSPTLSPLPPPPRPSRSPRRPSPTVSTSSSRVTSPVGEIAPASSRIPSRISSVGQNVAASSRRGRRRSETFADSPTRSAPASPGYISPPGSALPARSAPTSPSNLAPRARSSSAQSRLTFRELSEQRSAMSEREKNAMWEDLLERSNRAGGTLHLTGGDDQLPSDNLRFSAAASEILL